MERKGKKGKERDGKGEGERGRGKGERKEKGERRKEKGEIPFVSEVGLWSLSPCVFCRDPGDCLSLVHVGSGRIGFQNGFLVSDGK